MNISPNTLFVQRHVASAYFEPKSALSRTETFPFLFTPRTQRHGTTWSIDKFEVGNTIAKRTMQRKEVDEANPRLDGQENYSVLVVFTPELQELMRDKMAFTIETSVPSGKGDGVYYPKTHDIGIEELIDVPQ